MSCFFQKWLDFTSLRGGRKSPYAYHSYYVSLCSPQYTQEIKASILLLGSLQVSSGLYPKPRTAASFLAALSGVCVALMLPSAQAVTLTLAGGASNTWNSTSSWSPAQIPVNGDDLIFNTASATATNNFADGSLTLNSITFNASGQTLNQSATNGILIGAGGVTVGNSLAACRT